MLFLINSIYRATEGEGIHLGTPQVFVRYQGCTIGCVNCDSKDTWAFDEKTEQSLDQVLDRIDHEATRGGKRLSRLSITGGDPLHARFVPGLVELVGHLKAKGHFINLEASGARIVHEVFDRLDYISFDFKTPSTKVKTPLENVLTMARHYAGKFQVKSVVGNRADFDYILNAREEVLKKLGSISFPWAITPVINPLETFDRENFMNVLLWNEEAGGPFRIIGQQHKWIFGAEAKQV